jgi:hypothetical protein
MRRQNVLKLAALLLVTGCLAEDPETQSTTKERQIRCSLAPGPARGYARLVYFKYAGLCIGKGKYNGEHSVQENVVCRLYEDPAADGLVRIVGGTVDPVTKDCTFVVDDTGSLLVSRDDDGNTFAASTDPSLGGAMSCADQTVTLDADDGCTDGILPAATYDTTDEGSANGVQAVCDGKNKCTEYSGLSAEELARQQGLCAETWRQGTCSTASRTLQSGCSKALDAGGRRIVWEKNTARETCDEALP